MGLIRIVLIVVRGGFRDRAELAAENLALRQQLAVLQQKSKRPRLQKRDRIFWTWLARLWSNWRSALAKSPAGNSHPLASAGLQAVLAMEVAIQEARPPADRCRDPQVDSAHVARESTLGDSTHPVGTRTPWLRCVEGNCRQVQNPPPPAEPVEPAARAEPVEPAARAITDLAHLPRQSCSRHRSG